MTHLPFEANFDRGLVWNFAVSNYEVLPRWLRHREGESADFPTVNALLDLCARIAELMDLVVKADAILTAAVADPLTKTALNISR